VVLFAFFVDRERLNLVMHPVVELPGDCVGRERFRPVACIAGRPLFLMGRNLAAVATVYAAGEPPLGDG